LALCSLYDVLVTILYPLIPLKFLTPKLDLMSNTKVPGSGSSSKSSSYRTSSSRSGENSPELSRKDKSKRKKKGLVRSSPTPTTNLKRTKTSVHYRRGKDVRVRDRSVTKGGGDESEGKQTSFRLRLLPSAPHDHIVLAPDNSGSTESSSEKKTRSTFKREVLPQLVELYRLAKNAKSPIKKSAFELASKNLMHGYDPEDIRACLNSHHLRYSEGNKGRNVVEGKGTTSRTRSSSFKTNMLTISHKPSQAISQAIIEELEKSGEEESGSGDKLRNSSSETEKKEKPTRGSKEKEPTSSKEGKGKDKKRDEDDDVITKTTERTSKKDKTEKEEKEEVEEKRKRKKGRKARRGNRTRKRHKEKAPAEFYSQMFDFLKTQQEANKAAQENQKKQLEILEQKLEAAEAAPEVSDKDLKWLESTVAAKNLPNNGEYAFKFASGAFVLANTASGTIAEKTKSSSSNSTPTAAPTVASNSTSPLAPSSKSSELNLWWVNYIVAIAGFVIGLLIDWRISKKRDLKNLPERVKAAREGQSQLRQITVVE